MFVEVMPVAGVRGDRQKLLIYATVPEAAEHRAIMDVLVTAAEGYRSRLRPGDVVAALGALTEPLVLSPEVLERRLVSLCEWGNLRADRDESRAVDLATYERRAYVYDLTSEGEAAHEALLTLEEGLQRSGGLQTVVLRQILALLVEIVEAATANQLDGPVLYTRLEELHRSFKALTGNAAIFMQKVHRLLRSPVVEVAEFQVFKAETVAYLTGFMAELSELADEVRGQLDALDAVGEARRAAALAAAAAASGERALDGGDAEAVWIGLTEQHLAGLARWFRAGTGASAGAAVLSATVRNAVLGIARAVERIREAALAPSSRAADLLALARWFETAPDEDAAHRLWHAAFGLASARHLTHPGEDLPASTSWWDAPGADYPVRLRITTSGDHVRRPSRVADHAASKRLMAERVRREQDTYDRAAGILAGLGTTRLSDVDEVLDDACLDLLANLVARAEKQTPGRDGWQRARSVDGRLRIALREPAPRTATRLVTVRGRWIMRDYEVQISGGRGQIGQRTAPAEIVPKLMFVGER